MRHVALALVVGFLILTKTPLTCAQETTTRTAAEPMRGVRRIVFTGNSLTDGAAWPDWVIETLQANGHPDLVMYNAAVAGNSTAMLKDRYKKDVLGVEPDLVVINVGSADRKPAEDYRRDLGEIVRTIRATGAHVLVMAPAPVNVPKDPALTQLPVLYRPVAQQVAQETGALFGDTHAYFAKGLEQGLEMWGPDGIHHKIDAWRAMARCVLDTLGCHAPIIEKTSVWHKSITDWYVSPPVPWKTSQPIVLKNMPEDYDPVAAGMGDFPEPPAITEGFDPIANGWKKYDRAAEIRDTSWWQKSWLERGGVMPLGQFVVPDKPGSQARGSGAWGLAIVKMDVEKRITLHCGGSLPYAVWLNGKPVWKGNFLHGYHPSADRVTVTLRQGENHILVFTNWLFHISLGDI